MSLQAPVGLSAQTGVSYYPLPSSPLASASLLRLLDVCFLSLKFWLAATHESTFLACPDGALDQSIL